MRNVAEALDFSNQNLVVAGGSSGIGAETARLFYSCGATVAVIGRNLDRLNAFSRRIGGAVDSRCIVRSIDIRSEQKALSALAQLAADLGRVDIAVNCIGINAPSDIFSTSIDVWKSVIDTNLSGMFVFAKAICRVMAEQRMGAVVNVSSVQARVGGRSVQYAASKAGVEGFTRALARQMAPYNVRVNAVAPGATDTEFGRRHWTPTKRKELESVTLMKRLARPEEVASAILFLASDLASYITGSTLHVNGGALCD